MTIRWYHSFFFFLLGGLSLIACKKEVVPSIDSSTNYFPLTRGLYRIYQVDSIVHAESDNNNDDSVFTFSYQVKELLDSVWTDDAGRTVQTVIRYHRPDSSWSWRLTSVWTQQVSAGGAYRTEDNITYQKLAFPLSSTVVWNGNAANTLDDEYYRYDGLHVSFSIGGMTFDSVATVLQQDENNFVERIFGQERYATGVGLVYRRRDDLGKRNGQVVKGTEFTQELISYDRIP